MNSMETRTTTASNSTHPLPSFFKILLDDSNPNLPLPLAFVQKHFLDGEFPENPVLKTDFGGKWKVGIEKIGAKFCFVNGWLQFVKDTKTEVGDFLVFWLIGTSTFKVSIFGPNGCDKVLKFATPNHCACKCSGSGKSDTDMMNEKRIEEEDEDEDEETKIEVEEDEDEDEVMDEVRNDYDFKEEDIDEDDTDSDEDDDSEEFQEILNPSFEKVLTKSHKYAMRLPSSFIKEVGLGRKEEITIRNKEMKKWSVRIGRKAADGRYHLAHGWLDFWKQNNITEGDTCSFKYFRGEKGSNGFIEFEIVKKVGARKRGRPRKAETRRIN